MAQNMETVSGTQGFKIMFERVTSSCKWYLALLASIQKVWFSANPWNHKIQSFNATRAALDKSCPNKSTAHWPVWWMSVDITVKERVRPIIKDIRKVLETFHIWWTQPKMLQTSMTLKMIWMISYEVQYKPSLSGIIRALNMLTSSTCTLKRESLWISSGHSFVNGLGFGVFYGPKKKSQDPVTILNMSQSKYFIFWVFE